MSMSRLINGNDGMPIEKPWPRSDLVAFLINVNKHKQKTVEKVHSNTAIIGTKIRIRNLEKKKKTKWKPCMSCNQSNRTEATKMKLYFESYGYYGYYFTH